MDLMTKLRIVKVAEEPRPPLLTSFTVVAARLADLQAQLAKKTEVHEALIQKYGALVIQEKNAAELFRKLRALIEGAALLCPLVRGLHDRISSGDDLDTPARLPIARHCSSLLSRVLPPSLIPSSYSLPTTLPPTTPMRLPMPRARVRWSSSLAS